MHQRRLEVSLGSTSIAVSVRGQWHQLAISCGKVRCCKLRTARQLHPSRASRCWYPYTKHPLVEGRVAPQYAGACINVHKLPRARVLLEARLSTCFRLPWRLHSRAFATRREGDDVAGHYRYHIIILALYSHFLGFRDGLAWRPRPPSSLEHAPTPSSLGMGPKPTRNQEYPLGR